MDSSTFFLGLKESVKKFNEIDRDKPIRIISHLDADGLSAVSILMKALQRDKRKFVVSIVKQLNETLLKELTIEDYSYYIFCDLGSSVLNLISETLKNKKIFILDHHKPELVKGGVVHVNPHLYGINGAKEISGAGVVYFFSKFLNEKNKDLAYLALVGAIGDVQECKGFSGLNDMILKDAVDTGKIEVKEGLGLFGMHTKSLHKVLEYSFNPYIPSVSGSERGAIKFLEELGIELKKNGKFRKLIDLEEEELKKLITGIILKRMGSEENTEEVLGPIYLLKDVEEGEVIKDLKEFSTLLNSCGRMGKPSLGVGTCLGNPKLKEKAVDILVDYRQEIIKSLNWFYSNRGSNKIVEKDNYVLINAEENVKDTMIGTLASIISKSNFYKRGFVIVAFAHTLDGDIKVSLRVNADIDLREVIKKVSEKVGGVAGGHKQACGALISQNNEKEFLDLIGKLLDKMVIKLE